MGKCSDDDQELRVADAIMDDLAVLRYPEGVVCLVATANPHGVAIEGLLDTDTGQKHVSSSRRRVGMFWSTWPFRSGSYYTEDLARRYRYWYDKTTMTTVTIV
jgi:hypothetical protein